jgi:hypothetical protein
VRLEIPLEPPSEGFPSATAVPALIPEKWKIVASNASLRSAIHQAVRTCAQSTSYITRLNLHVESWPGSGSTEVVTPPWAVPSRRCRLMGRVLSTRSPTRGLRPRADETASRSATSALDLRVLIRDGIRNGQARCQAHPPDPSMGFVASRALHLELRKVPVPIVKHAAPTAEASRKAPLHGIDTADGLTAEVSARRPFRHEQAQPGHAGRRAGVKCSWDPRGRCASRRQGCSAPAARLPRQAAVGTYSAHVSKPVPEARTCDR